MFDNLLLFIADIPFPESFSELWKQLLGTGSEAHPIIQFIKYGVVGGISTAIHIFTFFLVGWFLFPCITDNDIVVRLLRLRAPEHNESRRAINAVFSNACAFLVSNTVCFILNRIFVFQPGKHHIIVEFLLFFVVSGIAIVLGTMIMKVLISRFKMQTSIAFSANLFTSLMLNYVLRKFLIFNG